MVTFVKKKMIFTDKNSKIALQTPPPSLNKPAKTGGFQLIFDIHI